MKIRPAVFADALPMAHVIVDAFLVANRDIMSEEAIERREREWTYEVSARNWEDAIVEIGNDPTSRKCLYVAIDDFGDGTEGVVGFALGCPSKTMSAPKHVGEIDILYVHNDHQRRGIGRALVQAVAADLAQKGMTAIHIVTPVALTASRRFYEALGGQVIGTTEDHEDGEVVPLVVYEWPDSRVLIEQGGASGKP
jgi:ribosomal protein S18 acetylase RimI-like enzyme